MDCIELFKQAAVALQSDIRYLELDAARKENDENQALQDKIGEFNIARMNMNELMSENQRDEAKIAATNEKINRLYQEIMNDEGMLRYNEAKKNAETLINHIDAIINTAMNGGDPMTVQEPTGGCTGSCSSCSGCH